jgi:hypothetical protein
VTVQQVNCTTMATEEGKLTTWNVQSTYKSDVE